MVNNKKITFNNKEYIFENSNATYNAGYGYVYIEGEPVEGGYIFVHEIGGVYNIINEIKEHYLFYLDKNIEVYEIAGSTENVTLNKKLSENKNLTSFLQKCL